MLVALGHFESRAAAQAAISAGRVAVNGVQLTKPSAKIRDTDRIEAASAHPWVSRGGVKLAHAMNPAPLKRLFGAFLILVALNMLRKALF